MAWLIEYTDDAAATLVKLSKRDKVAAARIIDYMDAVAALDDPRSRGKALTGNLAGLWRYRVGDYRIICDIDNGRLVVSVIDVGHRSTVYKGNFSN